MSQTHQQKRENTQINKVRQEEENVITYRYHRNIKGSGEITTNLRQ